MQRQLSSFLIFVFILRSPLALIKYFIFNVYITVFYPEFTGKHCYEKYKINIIFITLRLMQNLM